VPVIGPPPGVADSETSPAVSASLSLQLEHLGHRHGPFYFFTVATVTVWPGSLPSRSLASSSASTVTVGPPAQLGRFPLPVTRHHRARPRVTVMLSSVARTVIRRRLRESGPRIRDWPGRPPRRVRPASVSPIQDQSARAVATLPVPLSRVGVRPGHWQSPSQSGTQWPLPAGADGVLRTYSTSKFRKSKALKMHSFKGRIVEKRIPS
jgi:hypothetical protein